MQVCRTNLRTKVNESRTAIARGDVLDGPPFMRSKIAWPKALSQRNVVVTDVNK